MRLFANTYLQQFLEIGTNLLTIQRIKCDKGEIHEVFLKVLIGMAAKLQNAQFDRSLQNDVRPFIKFEQF